MASLLKTDGYDIAVVTPKIYKKSRYVEEQNGMKVYRFPFFSGNRLLIEYDKIPYLRMCFYYVSGFLLSSLCLHQASMSDDPRPLGYSNGIDRRGNCLFIKKTPYGHYPWV